MWFRTAAAMIPHPSKQYKGGEDAFFIYNGDNSSSVGVADGVGGWAAQGVDAGIYARQLCAACFDWCHDHDTTPTPVQAMAAAQEVTRVAGSSTCCVVSIKAKDDGNMLTANLGDSGFLVVRAGQLVCESIAQQHSFNFPYQLQYGGRDKAAEADQATVEVEPGDLVILGSDGLFDNLFVSDILSCIEKLSADGRGEEPLAEALASLAHVKAADPNYRSPFAMEAEKARKRFQGGKLDDITVVVATVCNGSATTTAPANVRPGDVGQALSMRTLPSRGVLRSRL